MTSANTLELQRVSGFDAGSAPVAGVDLVVPPGSTLALLGPARAGKSALLRLIAGFGTLTGGRVLFNGHDLARVPPHRRPFGFLGGQDALFPHMTVAGNVAYGLRSQGLGRSESARRVTEALARVACERLEAAQPTSLDRAQRQKVALARALAVEPLVLLLDDALSSLDPLEQGRLLVGLRSLQRDVGMTLLLSTTDGATAMAHADRIAVLAEGRLVQDGRPGELYDQPEHALTARMTGPVNLLQGLATRGGIRIDGLGELAAAGNVSDGSLAALALRPDRIELHLTAPPLPCLEGRIERLSYSGVGLTAHVRLGEGADRLAARIDPKRLDSADLPEGRRVWCTWNQGDARLVRL